MSQELARPRGRPRSFDEREALEKAVRVFWAKGYDAVTIDDLVACRWPKHRSPRSGRRSPVKRACVAMSLVLALLGTLRAALKARTDPCAAGAWHGRGQVCYAW